MRTPVICSLTGLQRALARIIASLALALSVALTASAQTQITTGAIQGTVQDANGAVVPGANVEIKHVETNISKSLTTDEEGSFKWLQLTPGKYVVTVSKSGFATYEDPNVVVTVGGTATVLFKMTVSAVDERVT